MAVLELTRRTAGERRAGSGAGVRWVKGAGAVRRVHSPRDMGKRNAERSAPRGPATLAIRWRLQVFFVRAQDLSDACSAGQSALGETVDARRGEHNRNSNYKTMLILNTEMRSLWDFEVIKVHQGVGE